MDFAAARGLVEAAMLGPIDLDDWSDDASNRRLRLRLRPEFIALKANPGMTRLNLAETDFRLLERFCAEESLSDAEIDALIAALGA